MIELKKWRDLYAVVVDGEIVVVNTRSFCRAYIKKLIKKERAMNEK